MEAVPKIPSKRHLLSRGLLLIAGTCFFHMRGAPFGAGVKEGFERDEMWMVRF